MIMVEDYQPTERDELALKEAGLTLEQLFAYRQPSQEALQNLQLYLGYTIVDAILMTNLRKSIIDALSQIYPLVLNVGGQMATQESLTAARSQFIEVVTDRMSGNPYPGINFSLENAQRVLDIAESEDWTPENFPDIFNRMMAICDEN